MKAARVLVIGLNALTCEVVKNLVLAGVGHLTLLDSSLVQANHVGAEFFLREGDIGAKVKALAFNSRI